MTRHPLETVLVAAATHYGKTVGVDQMYADRLKFEAAVLARRLVAEGIDDLTDITADHIDLYVQDAAVTRRRGERQRLDDPSARTQNNRFNYASTLLRALRLINAVPSTWHPLVDVKAPPRNPRFVRPLEGHEMNWLQVSVLGVGQVTRRAAAVAVAQTGAGATEINSVTVAAVNLRRGTVNLPGSARRRPRTGRLTGWGFHRVIGPYVTDIKRQYPYDWPWRSLIAPGTTTPQSRESSTSSAVAEALDRAGLYADPTVQPRSIAMWHHARVYRRRHRIEDVAINAGVRSLDSAARLAAVHWQPPCWNDDDDL